jgi:hypothetical protein
LEDDVDQDTATAKNPIQKAFELFQPELAAEVARQVHVQQLASGADLESAATFGLADRFYGELALGRIEGLPIVMWNGMDSFIFRQDPVRTFRYVTGSGRTISPRVMETDGGSIPRVLRSLSKFSSWGYGPAFVIHDWLFVAKKCRFSPDDDLTLEEAGKIMAEIMKTMMEVGYHNYDNQMVKLDKAEDTLYVMYEAVISKFARQLWDDTMSLRCLSEPNA